VCRSPFLRSRPTELVDDSPVGVQGAAFLHESRPQPIPDQPFQSLSVVSRRELRGVQRESGDVGAERLAVDRRIRGGVFESGQGRCLQGRDRGIHRHDQRVVEGGQFGIDQGGFILKMTESMETSLPMPPPTETETIRTAFVEGTGGGFGIPEGGRGPRNFPGAASVPSAGAVWAPRWWPLGSAHAGGGGRSAEIPSNPERARSRS
jgi:hypothetical protein